MHFHHLNVQAAVAINRCASGAGNIRAGPQNVGRALVNEWKYDYSCLSCLPS
jgi:hypothetical protein